MGLKVTESPAQSFAYVEALSCIGVGLEVFVNYHRTKLHGRILVCACKCSQIRELYQYVTTRSPKVSFQRCCSAGSSEFQRTAFVWDDWVGCSERTNASYMDRAFLWHQLKLCSEGHSFIKFHFALFLQEAGWVYQLYKRTFPWWRWASMSFLQAEKLKVSVGQIGLGTRKIRCKCLVRWGTRGRDTQTEDI
jgi:hypothetical protein